MNAPKRKYLVVDNLTISDNGAMSSENERGLLRHIHTTSDGRIPVDCPRAIPDGILERFSRWHEKTKRVN